jgi:hypothetical protein
VDGHQNHLHDVALDDHQNHVLDGHQKNLHDVVYSLHGYRGCHHSSQNVAYR